MRHARVSSSQGALLVSRNRALLPAPAPDPAPPHPFGAEMPPHIAPNAESFCQGFQARRTGKRRYVPPDRRPPHPHSRTLRAASPDKTETARGPRRTHGPAETARWRRRRFDTDGHAMPGFELLLSSDTHPLAKLK